MAGIYIHIPFCKTRCSYCDFYSTTVGSDLHRRYVNAVIAEAALRRAELDERDKVTTMYVGGGTPSQLHPELIELMVEGLNRCFDLSHVGEFTIEVNPDDVTEHYVAQLKAAGVNRISMGVQSFVDEELSAIGRRHTAAQAIAAVEAMRRAGITNVSIDLIYGLPHQTLTSWEASLVQALKLSPTHLSAYALSYEPGTRLWRQRERGEVNEAPDELSIAMYHRLTTMLKMQGYEHYEISNFALPQFKSRHNSSYWEATPYLGLGASAHSFDGTARRYNPAHIMHYIEAIEHGRTCCETEMLTSRERYNETVMVRLRTAQGIDLTGIETQFGKQAINHLMREAQRYLSAGTLKHSDSRLSLTGDGVMVSDAIIRDLML